MSFGEQVDHLRESSTASKWQLNPLFTDSEEQSDLPLMIKEVQVRLTALEAPPATTTMWKRIRDLEQEKVQLVRLVKELKAEVSQLKDRVLAQDT